MHEWGKWLVWDGTRWAKDRTGGIERLAQATVREMHKEALKLTTIWHGTLKLRKRSVEGALAPILEWTKKKKRKSS